MEKKGSSVTATLIDLSKRAIVSLVLDGGQKVAANIPKFKETGNGAIVMMMVPLCQEADIWLGGMSKFDTDGNPVNIREYTIFGTIAPGRSHTIQWEDPNDGHHDPTDCMAYVMMKIAYLSHLVEHNFSNRGEDENAEANGYVEENGYSQHRGAVCATIYFCGKLLMRIYLGFSGATEDEDQWCANQVAYNLRRHLTMVDNRFSVVLYTVDGVLE